MIMYENLTKRKDNRVLNKESDIRVINHYVDGAYIEILSELDKNFRVEFIKGDGTLEYSSVLKSNMWSKTSKKYFEEYTCRVWDLETNRCIYDQKYDASGKKVYIMLNSKSLGDTMAWFAQVEEFRKKWNCQLVCSTFWNHLFKSEYPDIEFVEPGTPVYNFYAIYKLGLFLKDGDIDYSMHPSNPRELSLIKIASNILGLPGDEIRPKINCSVVEKKKRVGIGFHSTAQAKYWNNKTGWQEVTDFLISNGYEVVILSKEEDGYMGNYIPKGAVKLKEGDISNLITNLLSCEFFIGISSGLSWLSWSLNIPTVLISGFTGDSLEPSEGVVRISNRSVCNDCWSRHKFDPGDWNWCPDHKGTERQFECSKLITGKMVIERLKESNLVKV